MTHVPVLFMGTGIAKAVLLPASPTDVAPTLALWPASRCRVPSGRVLINADAPA